MKNKKTFGLLAFLTAVIHGAQTDYVKRSQSNNKTSVKKLLKQKRRNFERIPKGCHRWEDDGYSVIALNWHNAVRKINNLKKAAGEVIHFIDPVIVKSWNQ